MLPGNYKIKLAEGVVPCQLLDTYCCPLWTKSNHNSIKWKIWAWSDQFKSWQSRVWEWWLCQSPMKASATRHNENVHWERHIATPAVDNMLAKLDAAVMFSKQDATLEFGKFPYMKILTTFIKLFGRYWEESFGRRLLFGMISAIEHWIWKFPRLFPAHQKLCVNPVTFWCW